MATKKDVKAAEAVAVEAAAPAEEKKTAAKKTVAAKKTTEKKASVKKSSENVYVQFKGIEITSADLIAKAKELSGVKDPKEVNVYVKPEDNKVYYVVDNNAGDFALVD